jgi:hypothetical protein
VREETDRGRFTIRVIRQAYDRADSEEMGSVQSVVPCDDGSPFERCPLNLEPDNVALRQREGGVELRSRRSTVDHAIRCNHGRNFAFSSRLNGDISGPSRAQKDVITFAPALDHTP